MKFNEQTLLKTIEGLKLDIYTTEQDLVGLELHKAELESELKKLRFTPPPDAIKNALIGLEMYPKLKLQNRREENDTEQHTTEDISSSDLCEGSDPLADLKSTNGVFSTAYQA